MAADKPPIRPLRSALVAAAWALAIGILGFHGPWGASATTKVLASILVGITFAIIAFTITLVIQLIRKYQ